MSSRPTFSLCPFDLLFHTSPCWLLPLQGVCAGWVEGGTLSDDRGDRADPCGSGHPRLESFSHVSRVLLSLDFALVYAVHGGSQIIHNETRTRRRTREGQDIPSPSRPDLRVTRSFPPVSC